MLEEILMRFSLLGELNQVSVKGLVEYLSKVGQVVILEFRTVVLTVR